MAPVKKERDFDREAGNWDTPPRVRLANDIAAAVIQRVHLDREMDVLDLGCGTGLLSLQLAPLVRSVTGVDSSKGMLEVLQGKAERAGLDNVTGLAADLDEDKSVAGRYHLVVSSMTLHHIQDVPRLLGRLRRSLHPGGYIALADLDKEDGGFHSDNTGVFHFGFDREELGRHFREAGFSDVGAATAAQMTKPAANGGERTFSIFLMTGRAGR